jgi:hypothetical protein
MVKYHCFANKQGNWNFWTEGDAVAKGSKDFATYDSLLAGYKIECTTKGTRMNQIQLFTTGIPIEAGKLYKLTFKAKSEGGEINASVLLMKASAPWTSYTQISNVTIEEGWNAYTVTFESTQTDLNGRLTFFLGDRMDGGTNIYVDSLSLIKVN